jgi:type I site-specific restriction endonuclease
LIGTSAIATGVDLRPTGCLIYLQGGKSEIAVRQGLGRGTRIVPGKKDFWVVDFNVPMSPTLMRHYRARKEIYETMGKVEES